MKLVLPTHDNIFVRRIEPTKTTEGGIVIPDQAQDRQAEGTIVAIGPKVITAARRARDIQEYLEYIETCGQEKDPTHSHAYYWQTFDIGDHVMFGTYAGIDVRIDDVTYVKLRPEEIFCITKETEAAAEEAQDANGE